jgi:outer membrane biosynthesis protein TonB
MSVPKHEMSLRPGRLEYKRLVWALIISILFHAMCFGGYEFSRTILPGWLAHIKMLAALAEQLKKKPAPPVQPQHLSEPPLMFVDVNPAAATPEPPKDAKFYSAQNSKAANPDLADSDIPKITGHQEHVVKAEDVPRTPAPLRPNAPQVPQPEAQKSTEPQQPEKEKPKPPVGDLAMAKPDTKPKTEPGKEEHTRPKTVVEAKTREAQRNQVTGEKMKQDGGVRRHLDISSFDAKATLAGAYDQALIDAIQQRWDYLLESRQFAMDRTGKVVVEFTLHYDGRVSDVRIDETTVGDTLAYVCRLAITDPAPYLAWPGEMRREIGDTRPIRFTFFY